MPSDIKSVAAIVLALGVARADECRTMGDHDESDGWTIALFVIGTVCWVAVVVLALLSTGYGKYSKASQPTQTRASLRGSMSDEELLAIAAETSTTHT